MNVAPSRFLYVFLDEAGNLDFSANGTRFFLLGALTKERPFNAYKELTELKYDLVELGTELEYFHASENAQPVRNRVFDVIRRNLAGIRIDALIVEKNKTGPALQAEEAFYPRMLGYWEGEQLNLQWGYHNPWRIEALGDALPRLDLNRIVADKRPVTNFNNSERRLVTVFLWQQGKLVRFLRLIAARDRAGFRSYFEAAMEKPLTEIEPLWQAYLAEIVAHRAEVMRVPGSVVLPNRVAYERVTVGAPPWRQVQAAQK